jgi:hypothetical protein
MFSGMRWLLPLFGLAVPVLADPPLNAEDAYRNTQVDVHLDWIRLPHAAANQLVLQYLKNSREAGALYAAAQQLIDQKKAERLDFSAVSVRNGQRSSSQSAIETPYPAEFQPPMSGLRINEAGEKFVGPLTHATPNNCTFREVGTIIELEASILEDGHTIELHLVCHSEEHLTDITWGHGVSELKQPVFGVMEIATKFYTGSGAWQFAGLLTPPATVADGKIAGAPPLPADRVLLFVRATNSRAPKAAAAPADVPSMQTLVLAEWIETELAAAAALLAKYPDFATNPALRAELNPMLADGRASLLQTAAVMARQGDPAKLDSFIDFPYPGEKISPHGRGGQAQAAVSAVESTIRQEGSDPMSNRLSWKGTCPPMPDNFSFRRVGTALEAEAWIFDGSVSLNLGPSLVFNAGAESFGQGISQTERARFQNLKSASQCQLAPNTPGMVASFDVPGSPGKEKEGNAPASAKTRKVLLFIRSIL